MTNKYLLGVYVPKPGAEALKEALFAAGAGKIGKYSKCCWQSEGTGQFFPHPGSSPSIGTQNRLETVTEIKLEMVLEEQKLSSVREALLKNHPYEKPAYHFIPIID